MNDAVITYGILLGFVFACWLIGRSCIKGGLATTNHPRLFLLSKGDYRKDGEVKAY